MGLTVSADLFVVFDVYSNSEESNDPYLGHCRQRVKSEPRIPCYDALEDDSFDDFMMAFSSTTDRETHQLISTHSSGSGREQDDPLHVNQRQSKELRLQGKYDVLDSVFEYYEMNKAKETTTNTRATPVRIRFSIDGD
jgi:hypothetical protein